MEAYWPDVPTRDARWLSLAGAASWCLGIGGMGLPESSWDDLLQFIDDGQVIPLVGRELLRVADGAESVSLDLYLARRLAQRLGVAADLPADVQHGGALNQVVCVYLSQSVKNRRERVYSQLRQIMGEVHPPLPEPLLKLAGIQHFKLYVSLTPDALLHDALAAQRGGQPDVLAYTPAAGDDLPCETARLPRPTVFHLLGRVSSTPDYVVTDEDLLEFLYALQSGRRPALLFDELKNHHLLFIGCSHPDWLSRFFLRLVKGARLSGPRDWQEFLADRAVAGDHGLTTFLSHFSYGTQVFGDGGGPQFVDELAERYAQRHPPGEPAAGATSARPGEQEMPPGAVFLSYTRQDAPAATRLYAALKELGADVWLDSSNLEGGDDWDREIKRNIRLCSFFLPLISRSTEARHEGYFRKEWRWAVDRAIGMEDSVPFIVPIMIDDTLMPQAMVPELFREKHGFTLPAGQVSEPFSARMVELLRGYRKREKHGR